MTTSLPLTPATALTFPTWPSVATFHQYGYNSLTILNNIKDLANEIVLFRNALKSFLVINSFYNSKEYFNYQRYSTEN